LNFDLICIVENELIFAIRENIASENIVFRELLVTLIRAIQARSIYDLDLLRGRKGQKTNKIIVSIK
jgi:hypothetical protein